MPAAPVDAVPLHVTRAERPEDAAFRERLFRETHGGMLAGLDPALVDLLLRQQLAGQTMTYRASYPNARYDIVEQDGAPIGRSVVDRAAEAITIVDIALLAAWRGRGIGTALLREVQDTASTKNLPVRLSVATGNPAQRLYARLGFVALTATATHVEMVWGPS